MDDALIRRLSLPQFFLRQARVALQRPGPYSGGMATSLLQDCVETFLRILSEHGRIDVGVSTSFDKLINNIGEKFASTLEHRALLSRMNKARVAFKHHGILVPSEDALYFSQGVETFLSEMSLEILNLNFESVSLISAIGHRRTENWLHKAQNFSGSGKLKDSLECAAKAFAIYTTAMSMNRLKFTSSRMMLSTLDFFAMDHRIDSSLGEFTRSVKDNLEQIYSYIDLIMTGVNLSSYRRFRALTPSVQLTVAKTLYVYWGFSSPSNLSKEDAIFCIDFVVDSALQIRDNFIPDWDDRKIDKATQSAIVEHDCDVIVHPSENPPEVIRTAYSDEELLITSNHLSGEMSEYVTVLQDGEPAYVRSDCIRVLYAEREDSVTTTPPQRG